MEPIRIDVGQVIEGKYRVQRCIGRGGMSIVVEALHLQLGQRVAIKLVRGGGNSLDEARTAAALSSEHAVRVSDCGRHGDLAYIVMEQLEGVDLKAHLASVGAETVPEAAAMILQVCEAIGEAHSHGIVHADLKPSNLFVSRRVDGSRCMKVLDFGIARSERGGVLANGTIAGSPGYAAPEQLVPNGQVDVRADVWALGIILYKMVSGEMPFPGKELGQALLAALTRTPRPLRGASGPLPNGFAEVVMRCLAKDREDRFPNVGELALALAPFAREEHQSYAKRTKAVLASTNDNPVLLLGTTDDRASLPSDVSLSTEAPVVDPTFDGADEEPDVAPSLVGELVPSRPGAGIFSIAVAAAMLIALLVLAKNHVPATRVNLMRTAAAATPTVAPRPSPPPPMAIAMPAPTTTASASIEPAAQPSIAKTAVKPAAITAKTAPKKTAPAVMKKHR